MPDSAAYLRSLAQMRGRNVDWADRAVRVGVSLSATEAQTQRVIDFIAADLPALLSQAHGRTVQEDRFFKSPFPFPRHPEHGRTGAEHSAQRA